jgi:hypothetical protein
MEQPTFIRLENTLADALYYKGSPIYKQLYFGGVQLLTNSDNPYVQRTYVKGGIDIPTWEIKVKDLCGNTVGDVTTLFEILNTFIDANGYSQLYWRLQPNTEDYGYQLVYLEIHTAADTFAYSSPFYWTEHESDRTVRVDYRMNDTDIMLSTQLQMFFKQDGDEHTLSNYTSVSTGKLINVTSQLMEFEYWQTAPIRIDLFRLIKKIFLNKERYFDYKFTSLKEAFDTPELTADENYAEQEILLAIDYDRIYDPEAESPTPPPPPVYEIVLESVNWIPIVEQVSYYFTLVGGFNANFLVLEVSEDNINFDLYNSTVSPAISPKTNLVPDAGFNDYWYRISYPVLGLVSNTVQLSERGLNIVSANRISSTEFDIEWQPENYVPEPDNELSFEFSSDSVKWARGLYDAGNVSPKRIATYVMTPEAKFFRIYDEENNIMSNTFELI